MRSAPFLFVFALGIAAPSFAFAQTDETSAQDIESARAAFTQGLELRDKQRNYPAAIDKLKAAYALVPTPRIAYELGKTYRMNKDLLNARSMFLEVDRIPVRGKESEEAKNARTDARIQAVELESKIPTLTIRLVGEGEATLTLDDQPIARETLAAPRKLNPGRHRLGLQLPNRPQANRTIELQEGEQKDLEIKLPAPTTKPTNDPNEGFQATSYEHTTTRADPLHQVLFWTGIAGITVGSITGIYAIVTAADGAKKCDPTCTADATKAKNDAMVLAWTSNITFIVGGASLLAYFLVPPLATTKSTTVGFSPMPGGAFASFQGRF